MGTWGGPARDLVLPLVLAGVTVADVLLSPETFASRPVAASVVLVPLALVLAARRHRPGWTAALVALLTATYMVGVQRDLAVQPPIEPFLAVLVSLFNLGAHAGPREFVAGGGVSAAVLLGAEGAALAAGRPLGDVAPAVIFWSAATVTGRMLHLRRREAAAAHDRATRAEHLAREQAEQAVAHERSRIARELHDVVAHNLSVLVVQAAAEARAVRRGDYSSTAQTLARVERTGREALAELRTVLGLLRADDEPGALDPPPGLDQLDTLLEQLRRSGLDVAVDVAADLRDLPSGLSLSAYRIVQEALTNCLKHAPGTRVCVRVNRDPHALIVDVENGPPLAHLPPPGLGGGGHGMLSMRERVRVYGGSLQAGARPDGGYAVRAVLPLTREGP